MKSLLLAACSLLALALSPTAAFSQEKGKKAGPAQQMVNQFMKQLEKAELTEDQATKAKELMMKTAKEVIKMRTDAEITPEMMKKRTEASKAAREAGKKPKEVQEAVKAAVPFTEAQFKVITEGEAAVAKTKIEIGKLLKPEQIAKLPPMVQASLKEKAPKKEKK
ncbi:hypothetical protein SH501x_004133 [Pirellulaceae bacterium SH501]